MQQSNQPDELLVLESKAKSHPESVEANYELADAYAEQNRWNEAIEHYQIAIRLDPANSDLQNSLGIAYEEAGRLDEAERVYQQAIALSPENSMPYYNLGDLYEKRQLISNAIQAYKDCLEHSTDSNERSEVKRKIADLTSKTSTTRRRIPLKAYALGLAVVLALVVLISNFLIPPASEATDHFNRADTYAQQGQWDLAIQEYTQGIQIDPQSAQAYRNRGFAYFASNRGQAHRTIGDYEQAIADFDKAIALGSNDAALYLQRGMAYLQLSDLQQAMADLNKAIELDPQFANAYLFRGVVNVGLRQREKAVADLEKSVDLGLEPDFEQQATVLLQQLKSP